jgi:hypothetical protein
MKLDGHELRMFNLILNKILKQQYDWFVRIDVSSAGFNGHYITMEGEIFVYEDWGYRQWKEYHYGDPPDFENGEDFGDIIGGLLAEELREIFIDTFKSIYGFVKTMYLTFSGMNVRLVEEEQIDESVKLIKKLTKILK